MDTLKQKGISAFFWSFFGGFMGKGMQILFSIFLARLLVPEDFGVFAIASFVFAISSMFNNVGLGAALIQRKRVLDIHYNSVFYFTLMLSVFFTLVTIAIAPWIAQFYDNPLLEPMLYVMSTGYVINTAGYIQSLRFRKVLNYKVMVKSTLVINLIGGIFSIAMAYYGYGVWSLIIPIVLKDFSYAIYIWLKSDWRPSLSFSMKALRQLWVYGFRMFLSLLLNAIFLRVDYMIIGKLFPLATVGYLQKAKSLNELAVKYSSGALMSVLFPVLSKIQNDLQRFQNVFIDSLNGITFMAFLILGSLYLSAESIVILMFGEQWIPSVAYFKIIVLSGFSLPISALFLNVISSRGNSKGFLRLEIYKKMIMSTDFIVLYYYGVMNYLYYRIFSAFIILYLEIHFATKEINMMKTDVATVVIPQVMIGVFSVFCVSLVNSYLDLGHVGMLLLNTFEYVVLYILINKVFNTDAYSITKREMTPHIIKLRAKLTGKTE